MRAWTVGLVIMVLGAAIPEAGFAQADASVQKQQEISVDVVRPVVGAVLSVVQGRTDIPFSVFYRRILSTNTGFSIGPTFDYRGPASTDTTLNLWVDFDVYPFDTELKGFFLGPQAVFSLKGIFSNENTSSTVGLGVVVGYLWRLDPHVNVDAVAGVALGASYLATTNTYGLSVIARLNLGIGYVW